MGAVAIAQYGPPIRWGNAAGKAIIAEKWRVPESTAADTATLTSINIAKFIGLIGPATHTAVVDNEAGVSVAVITSKSVDTDNFVELLLVGFARDGAPS